MKAWKISAEHYLAVELQLKLKYAVLNTTDNGVPFLGFLIQPGRIDLLRYKKRRARRTWKCLYWELFAGTITQHQFAERITASLSHLKLARSHQVVYDILQRYDHRLEPGSPGRQLEHQCAERSFGESQQQYAVQSQQQQRVPGSCPDSFGKEGPETDHIQLN